MRNDQPELMELNHRTNLFEILIRRLAYSRCRPGDVCVDAGANQGNHAVPMASAVAPTGMIHAFEPIRFLVDRLRSIASERGLPMQVYGVALSDRVGTSQFQYVKNMPGVSGLYDRKLTSTVDAEMIDVDVSMLDIVLRSPTTCDHRFMVDAACKLGVTASWASRRGRSAGHPGTCTVLDGSVLAVDFFGMEPLIGYGFQ
jgi:FkbM family methyltransferase